MWFGKRRKLAGACDTSFRMLNPWEGAKSR
jgi:hypothetical protein